MLPVRPIATKGGRKRKAPASNAGAKRPNLELLPPAAAAFAGLAFAGLPLAAVPPPLPLEDLAYSNLMKRMAEKYRDREAEEEEERRKRSVQLKPSLNYCCQTLDIIAGKSPSPAFFCTTLSV